MISIWGGVNRISILGVAIWEVDWVYEKGFQWVGFVKVFLVRFWMGYFLDNLIDFSVRADGCEIGSSDLVALYFLN